MKDGEVVDLCLWGKIKGKINGARRDIRTTQQVAIKILR